MRHSPLYHSSGQSGSRLLSSSYINHVQPTSSRPPFTRSHSVPEQTTIDYLQDSEQEELLLEAAANTLDEPLPILLNDPALLRPHSRQSYFAGRRAAHLGAAPFSTSLPDRRSDVFRSTTGTPFLTRPLSSRLSHSSELPTTNHSAAVQDRLSLLYAEIEAAAAASRRLTAPQDERVPRIPGEPSYRVGRTSRSSRHSSRSSTLEPPLTIGRSLQLVTESASARASAQQGDLSNSLRKKSVRFNSEEWNRRNRHLLQDPSLFPSGLGIEEDAWMSVEDVRTGRWARWDALVKQESQDSQTRDSGIETGSCFTSSEDSNRGSASDHLHGYHHHHCYQKKVWSSTWLHVYWRSSITFLLTSLLFLILGHPALTGTIQLWIEKKMSFDKNYMSFFISEKVTFACRSAFSITL